jgi:sodium transport system permease protein
MPTRFVLLTLGKELRETLRDRRTLAVMVLVPLVLYPLLALIGSQLIAQRQAKQAAQASVVAVLGAGADADELRRRLDEQPKLFERRPTGTDADVDTGKLDALVKVAAQSENGRRPVTVVLDATRDEGRRADTRLSEVIDGIWPPGCAPRFSIDRHNLAPESRLGGYVLSQVLPIMILLMVVLGAFYPAIDVTAGERERGTLETILVAPIPRLELLIGKVLAVTLLASASGFLNLGSMTLTLVQVVNLAAPDAAVALPFARAAATGLVIFPTAFLLAALFVAIGSLARGFKEAQNLLVPVYVVFFAPAIMGAMGDLPLSTTTALVPGLNVSVLARDIALGKARAGTTAIVLLTTLGWGLLALAAAARLYVSERFLAASDESPRKDKVGMKGFFVRSDPPTAGEALALFGVGIILLYFAFIPLQRRDIVAGLLISQWLGLAGVSVLFALVTRRQPAAAFGWRRPPGDVAAAAVLIGLGGWMVANVVSQWVFPPPKEYIEAFRKLLFPETQARGVVVNLLLFAVTPAFCEELFFRGVLLRGLLTRMSPAGAIGVSATMFALFHVDVYRLLPTGLLGLLLGFVAYRGGTFLASVIVHFLNNAILVLLGAAGLDRRIEGLGTAAELGLLAAAATVVTLGMWRLLRKSPDQAPGPGM